jgi:hypothetical protein
MGDHQRHGSLSKLYGRRTSCDILSEDIADDSGELHNEVEHDGSTSTAGLHSSMNTGLVGSIRGLGRRAISSNLVASMSNLSSPTKHSVEITLPSSPIDIPQAAPLLALRLDLGPAAFLPNDFASPSKTDSKSQFTNGSFTSNSSADCKRIDTICGVSEDPFLAQPGRIARPVTPGELLSLPTEAFDFVSPMLESPMPGTTLGLELDDGIFDSGKVFERTVESSPQTEDKDVHGLRSKSSLDALAQACFDDDDLNLSGLSVSERNFLTSPFDATELNSQPLGSKKDQQYLAEFDLLISEDKSHSSGASDLLRQDSALASQRLQGVINQQAGKPPSSSRSQPTKFEGRTSMVDEFKGGSSEDGERFLDTGEYEHFKTEFIFGDLRPEASPIYDGGRNLTPPISTDLVRRSSTASLSAQMFQRVSRSNSSSPRSIRAGTTHRADMGDFFWTADVLDRQAGLTHRSDAGMKQFSQQMSYEPRNADQQGGTATGGENIHVPVRSAEFGANERGIKDTQTADLYSFLLPHEKALFAQPLPLRLKNRHASNTSGEATGVKRTSSMIPNDIEGDVFADTNASEFDRASEPREDDSSCLSIREKFHQHELLPFPHIV